MEKILEQPTAKATGSEVQFVMRSETKAQGISSVFEPTPLHRLPLSNTYYCNQPISLPISESGRRTPDYERHGDSHQQSWREQGLPNFRIADYPSGIADRILGV